MSVVKMIKNVIKNIFNWATVEECTNDIEKMCSYDNSINVNGINFTVFSAIGGQVVQVSVYNQKIDRSHHELYIITDQDNLGEELGQIITRVNLTR